MRGRLADELRLDVDRLIPRRVRAVGRLVESLGDVEHDVEVADLPSPAVEERKPEAIPPRREQRHARRELGSLEHVLEQAAEAPV